MKRALACVIFVLLFQSSLLWADVLSIPCSALITKDHNVQYDCNGARLVTGSANQQDFNAPVFLPTGSQITKFSLEAADNSGGEFGGYVKCVLSRAQYNTIRVLSTLQTDGQDAPGEIRMYENLLPPELVDNDIFSYNIAVTLLNGAGGSFSTWFFKAIIEFEPPVKRNAVVIPLFE